MRLPPVPAPLVAAVIAYPEKRSIRRLLKRQADAKRAEDRRAAKLAAKMARLDPRDPTEDRRQAERRVENLEGDPLTAKLRAAGLNEDRRHGQRRSGVDRRR